MKKQVFLRFFLFSYVFFSSGVVYGIRASSVKTGSSASVGGGVLSTVQLLSSLKAVSNSTQAVPVGIHVHLAKGWYSYGEYPGKVGKPLKLKWLAPEGLKVGALKWPTALKLVKDSIVSFVYKDKFLLMSDVQIPPSFLVKGGSVTLKAHVEWLICKEVCIPYKQQVSLTLPVKNEEEVHASHTMLFHQWLKKVPVLKPEVLQKKKLPLGVSKSNKVKSGKVVQSKDISLKKSTLQKSLFNRWEVGIVWILVLAFLGGMILNVMPCVLPVVFLKFSHTLSLKKSIRGIVLSNLVYSAGVVFAFLVLAFLLIIFKAGGDFVGWGFQMQSPYFLVSLILLFMLISFSFMGWVLVPSVGGMQLYQIWSKREGKGKNFLTGMLSTIVASPCTAPFMAGAIGYALMGSVSDIVLVFTFLGLGLSFPYLLLAIFPKCLRYVPSPGVWSEQLKKWMAFPMWASVVWLLSVLNQHQGGVYLLPTLMSVVFLSMGFWLVKNAKSVLWLVWVGWLVVMMSVLYPFFAVYFNKGGHVPVEKTAVMGDTLLWEDFSIRKMEQIKSEGQALLVNFSAKWCLTCLFNERMTFKNKKVIKFIKEHNIRLLKGDWTHKNPEIAITLSRWDRVGIPFALYFPPQKNGDVKHTTDKLLKEGAIVLPELLTPSIFLKLLTSYY